MHRLWPTMNYYFIIITRRGKKKGWASEEERGGGGGCWRGERAATALLNCNVLGAQSVLWWTLTNLRPAERERGFALLSLAALSLALSPGRGKKKGRFLQITANKAKKIKGNPANCAPRAGWIYCFRFLRPELSLQSGGRRWGKVARVDIIKFVCCFNRIAPGKKSHSMERRRPILGTDTQINSILLLPVRCI